MSRPRPSCRGGIQEYILYPYNRTHSSITYLISDDIFLLFFDCIDIAYVYTRCFSSHKTTHTHAVCKRLCAPSRPLLLLHKCQSVNALSAHNMMYLIIGLLHQPTLHSWTRYGPHCTRSSTHSITLIISSTHPSSK